MNKLIIVFSFICVLSLHFFVLNFYYKKESIKIQNQEKYSKLTLQLTKLRKAVKKKQEIEKTTTKVKQKPIKKTIKKVIKRKESKKTKNIVKTTTEKPPKIEKKVQKRIQKKEIQEKKFIQTQNKEIIKQDKNKTQSLKRFKQFKDDYSSKIRAKIDKNKIYPRSSKRLKEEGGVLVSFRVLKNGTFTNIILVKSSSINRLDKAALNAVIDAKEYKSFPKEIKKEFLDFSILIEFRII